MAGAAGASGVGVGVGVEAMIAATDTVAHALSVPPPMNSARAQTSVSVEAFRVLVQAYDQVSPMASFPSPSSPVGPSTGAQSPIVTATAVSGVSSASFQTFTA